MNIEKELTDGCDMASHVYSNMFNLLEEAMHDGEKLKELSPLDFSALGLYIGKFVEQEINSSVVQIMRAFFGIPMPDYYCKPYPDSSRTKAIVQCRSKVIQLNEVTGWGDDLSLKTVMLGDAFSALEQSKALDKRDFFAKYPWLNDQAFLGAWRNLNRFRNEMAHIGEIIDAETLKENYEQFLVFLEYMPNINQAKKELAPKGYKQSLKTTKKKKEGKSYYASTRNRDKGLSPKKNAQGYLYAAEELNECLPRGLGRSPYSFSDDQTNISPKPIRHISTYNAKVFKGRNGKKGLKDHTGNILVPVNYDDFGFLPKPFDDYKRKSVIALSEEKYVLVALDGSGEELTKEPYDEIILANKSLRNSPYVYRKNHIKAWGIMNESGKEMCDNIIDNYICGKNNLWYESGELKGCWFFGKDYPFLPPVFDNIEMIGKPGEPLLFTLDGVDGYVEIFEDDYEFIPMSELDKMDAEDRRNTLECCLCEE